MVYFKEEPADETELIVANVDELKTRRNKVAFYTFISLIEADPVNWKPDELEKRRERAFESQTEINKMHRQNTTQFGGKSGVSYKRAMKCQVKQ